MKIDFNQAEQGNAFQATVNNPNVQTCQSLLTTHWEGAGYLNVVTDGRTKRLNLSEGSSSISLCKKVQSVSIIYR